MVLRACRVALGLAWVSVEPAERAQGRAGSTPTSKRP